jgi:hypothetical protein
VPESLDGSAFVALLAKDAPELHATISEHYADNDELLLHLLLADVLRYAAAAFKRDRDVVRRILDAVDLGLRTGDEYVQNAVAVSFVEHVGAYPDQTRAFIASWPAALAAERQRQINYRT